MQYCKACTYLVLIETGPLFRLLV